MIYGTRWDDTIIGGDADQDIHIIGGENFIHGKGGTDTVHIDGLRDDFNLVNFDGQFEVISASQTQTLEDVEFLRFDNETVDLSTVPVALSVPFDADGQNPNVVMENVELGTYTGLTISADAAAGSETVTLSLIDDAGGRFALNGNGQVITAGDIDYEIYDSHLITVEAISNIGLSTTKTFRNPCGQ